MSQKEKPVAKRVFSPASKLAAVRRVPSRTVYYDGAYAPYGENYAESGTTDRNFTGQNQDTASDLYDFLYREYHPTQGRWIQPDPAGLAAVDISNPQSWNRYGYVRNIPLASVDVNGLCSGDNGNFFDDDNHGTVWFHGPCSGGPIGTDPDTVNVSGLFGPVGSSAGQQSGQAGQSGGVAGGRRGPRPVPPARTSPNNGDSSELPAKVKALFNRPWVLSWIVPLVPVPVVAGIGPAGDLEWNPDTHTACMGIGIGASAGHNAAVGPLTNGTTFGGGSYPAGADGILAGWSLSGGYNTPAFIGVQGMVNGSGAAVGPSVGVPGASVASTYSVCATF